MVQPRRFVPLIDELSLNGKATLLGALPEEMVRSEFEAAHVFALASHNEALGVATMEAMAMELPVVVTGVGGVAELVADGIDGVLAEPKSPSRLAESLRRVLGEPSLAKRLGEAGRRKIEARFHSGLSAQRIAGYLQTLAGPLARRRSWFSQGASCR